MLGFPHMRVIATTSFLLTGLLLAQPGMVTAKDTQSPPQDKTFGVGLMLGEPTGASLKYWLSEVSAIDAVAGITLDDDNDFAAHADYLYHFNDVVVFDHSRFSAYFGGGPRFQARDRQDDIFGLRAVVGLDYIFDDIPVDVFIEVGPQFDITPDYDVSVTGGVGARFWF